MDPDRVFRIVTGVVGEALRAAGARGTVLVGDGPEADLLEGWFQRASLPVARPLPRAVRELQKLLESGDPEGGGPSCPREEAGRLLARLRARREGLLLLHPSHKTGLLLSAHLPPEPILPLGDLYASEIRALAGACTLPPLLAPWGPGVLGEVDRALRSRLEEGRATEEAFGLLKEEVRRAVLESLHGARRAWHRRPLIPKLGEATLGADLDL